MLTIERIEGLFAVCKVEDYSQVDTGAPFVFTGCSDAERSLVCPSERVPANALVCEDGWCAFRIAGTLDFSLIGILASVSDALAKAEIGIFALSTYDTDYLLVKQDDYEAALEVLAAAGHTVI